MTQEIYALSSNRSIRFANLFLNEFLARRAVYAKDFPVPEFSDKPEGIFHSVDSLLAFLEENPTESYSIYWNSLDEGGIRQAMLFYTSDNQLIVGLAVDLKIGGAIYSRLLEFTGSEFGLFGCEQPPPRTASEFKELTRRIHS